ncbi:DNA/RNA helicase domain-containing protein [Paucilactobacillus suebicus]|uniref:DUF2075 domain-containing protein n=1 Tax=Paucilactobacillus suebicus TaxID=152335 RepID=UPI00024901D5|nr:DUF2075 domain-containing protein [Paucilactobacillus suebicus]
MDLKSPVIKEVKYNEYAFRELERQVKGDEKARELLLEYPTDYIIYSSDKDKDGNYDVYVGETNDIGRRTMQHLNDDSKERDDWEYLSKQSDASMFVIGHEHFNKSLTLDIENRMMLYLTSVDHVKKLNNRRFNNQNKYYTSEEMADLFSKIWRSLRKRKKDLFPIEQVIKDSAIFKASPFHSLTNEQHKARELILDKVKNSIRSNQTGQLIFVEGDAGSGKTVLLSSLFYTINTELVDGLGHRPRNYLLVNHDQQLTVYQQIAKKLDLDQYDRDVVSKPTHFINTHDEDDPVDVVLIDEAHLLWTQGKQSYQGKNQLSDILARAKVTIVIFDKHQSLTTEEYWKDDVIDKIRKDADNKHNLIKLNNQMRMDASPRTISWIRSLVYDKNVKPIPIDDRNYDLKIFDSPIELEKAIRKHDSDKENQKDGLSRLLATFDWEYKNNKNPDDGEYWEVKVDNWERPWNLQIKGDRNQRRKNKGLSWAEQTQTINEIGSTYTIQGFDLNYSGVIIGPSVKYRKGKIIFDPHESHNHKAIQNRTVDGKTKVNNADRFLQNELNVLLTRGVHGLYIYAVDDELRQALLDAQKNY